ncbi:MAG: hypothetical protein GYA62_08855 [Bacteroidales bacterium]|nr:hypothetical protein [Bacteroidales bacterium]
MKKRKTDYKKLSINLNSFIYNILKDYSKKNNFTISSIVEESLLFFFEKIEKKGG